MKYCWPRKVLQRKWWLSTGDDEEESVGECQKSISARKKSMNCKRGAE